MPVVRYRSEMTTRQGSRLDRDGLRGPGRLRRAGRDAGPPIHAQPRGRHATGHGRGPGGDGLRGRGFGHGAGRRGAVPAGAGNMLWLSPATEIALTAGRDGLECMLAHWRGHSRTRPESGEAQRHRATG